jgi:hypothetical protein
MDTSAQTSSMGGGAADAPFDPRRPPVKGFRWGHPVPDLTAIPEEHWLAVLIEAHPLTYPAARAGLHGDQVRRAAIACGQAIMERPPPRETPVAAFQAAAYPQGIPGIDVRPPSIEPPRQVNFRLSAEEYEQLQRTARLLGVRPSAAARLLAIRGVQQVLREADGPAADQPR